MYWIIIPVIAAYTACFYFFAVRKKKGRREEAYRDKKSRTAFFQETYRFFSHWKPTRGYVRSVRRQFETIEPGNVEYIETNTMRTALLIWLSGILAIFAVCLYGITLYSLMLSILSVYFFSTFILNKRIEGIKYTLLGQQAEAMEALEDNYYLSEDVGEALYETAVNAPQPVGTQLNRIWEILQSDEEKLPGEIEKYNVSAPNPFLKDLLSTCFCIGKYGDRKVNGIWNFIRCLTKIGNDISVEQRKAEKIRHQYATLSAISVFPVLLMKPAEMFAKYAFGSAGKYYGGAYGIFCMLAVYGLSMAAYYYIERSRAMDFTPMDFHPALAKLESLPVIRDFITVATERDAGRKQRLEKKLREVGESMTVRQFFAKRLIYGCAAFCIGIIAVETALVNGRHVALDYRQIDSSLLQDVSAAQGEEETDFLLEMAHRYKKGKYSKDELLAQLRESGYFSGDGLLQAAYGEVEGRVAQYRAQYFRWQYFVLTLAAAFLASFIPLILLRQNAAIIAMKMEDEVMRFLNMIYCMMYQPRAGVMEILEQMELCADMYRNSLTQCIDEFGGDESVALKNLKDREVNPLFRRIVDKLVQADYCGIEKAFANLGEEISEAQKKREQKNNIYIDNGSTLAFTLAFLPTYVMTIFWMIVPMLLALSEQMESFNNLIRG